MMFIGLRYDVSTCFLAFFLIKNLSNINSAAKKKNVRKVFFFVRCFFLTPYFEKWGTPKNSQPRYREVRGMFWGDFWVILGVHRGEILDFGGQKLQNCKTTFQTFETLFWSILQFCSFWHLKPGMPPMGTPKMTQKSPQNIPLTSP